LINFGITNEVNAALKKANGAYTNDLAFSSDNKISIVVNPGLVKDAVIPGSPFNSQRFVGGIPVPSLGIAVIHEFGHAYGNYEGRVPGAPGAGFIQGGTNSSSLKWENKARAWYYAKRPDLRRLVRLRH
jgi:hypothetical protein